MIAYTRAYFITKVSPLSDLTIRFLGSFVQVPVFIPLAVRFLHNHLSMLKRSVMKYWCCVCVGGGGGVGRYRIINICSVLTLVLLKCLFYLLFALIHRDLRYSILIFCHVKLCLATAIHNFK